MKKRLYFIIALMTLIACLLMGCGYEPSSSITDKFGFIPVPGKNNLYYDGSTKIVYVMAAEYGGYQGYGYMSAYYAENGLPYRYDVAENMLVMIED